MLAALSVEQFQALQREGFTALLEDMLPVPSKGDDGPLDRSGAAAWLKVSLAKLDQLCRREADPLPWHLAGDSRRFFRDELREWVKRQRGGAK